ncbi:hypothetical protein [Microbulbifer sp. SSSA005]|uniref:hypothetical protein n=1 Tax=Microbulbifer sp. SSSA005 TaxID=3243378 RepID=UPI0040392450
MSALTATLATHSHPGNGQKPTQEAAKELAQKIAKSKKALFYSWLQILDIVTGKFAEYSIERGRVLVERCPDTEGQLKT